MALDEDLGVVEAGRVVVRRQIEHRLEQQLRIVENVALDANAREQTHGLDVMAVLQQEGANEMLGRTSARRPRTARLP